MLNLQETVDYCSYSTVQTPENPLQIHMNGDKVWTFETL